MASRLFRTEPRELVGNPQGKNATPAAGGVNSGTEITETTLIDRKNKKSLCVSVAISCPHFSTRLPVLRPSKMKSRQEALVCFSRSREVQLFFLQFDISSFRRLRIASCPFQLPQPLLPHLRWQEPHILFVSDIATWLLAMNNDEVVVHAGYDA